MDRAKTDLTKLRGIKILVPNLAYQTLFSLDWTPVSYKKTLITIYLKILFLSDYDSVKLMDI